MIKIENLSKKYGAKKVLKNINIEFKQGNVYGIVGKNGAGKTTLFHCISGLEKYDGKINSKFQTIKNHLGLLQTEPYFFSRITGIEYIRLLSNARDVELENIKSKNVFDLPLNQYTSTYSTGMKKKLALTAVLLQENDIYLLDEPYNGVDIQSNIIITEIINQLKNLNKTILISSHVFSTLKETCDQIHLLDNGEFIKSVNKNEFENLEQEMKQITIGNKIKNMKLK